jgi:hypothetical protein
MSLSRAEEILIALEIPETLKSSRKMKRLVLN